MISWFGPPQPAILGNQAGETLNGVAWFLLALAALIFVVQVGRRITHMQADVKGMKLSVDTEVKPALGLPPTPSSVEGKAPGGEAPPLSPLNTGEIPLMKRLETVEDTVKLIPQLLERLDEFAKHDAQRWAALVSQLGITIPHINDRSPEGRQP